MSRPDWALESQLAVGMTRAYAAALAGSNSIANPTHLNAGNVLRTRSLAGEVFTDVVLVGDSEGSSVVFRTEGAEGQSDDLAVQYLSLNGFVEGSEGRGVRPTGVVQAGLPSATEMYVTGTVEQLGDSADGLFAARVDTETGEFLSWTAPEQSGVAGVSPRWVVLAGAGKVTSTSLARVLGSTDFLVAGVETTRRGLPAEPPERTHGFLMRLSNDGALVWEQHYGHPLDPISGTDGGHVFDSALLSVAEDLDGTVIASGYQLQAFPGVDESVEPRGFLTKLSRSGTRGPTCDDNVRIAPETGVDCGGPCPACLPTCDDGTRNGPEQAPDCGNAITYPDALDPADHDLWRNQTGLQSQTCNPCPCDDGCGNGVRDCGQDGPDCCNAGNTACTGANPMCGECAAGPSGEAVYGDFCAGCHQASGCGAPPNGPATIAMYECFECFEAQVRNARDSIMRRFDRALLPDSDLQQLFDYVQTLTNCPPPANCKAPAAQDVATQCP